MHHLDMTGSATESIAPLCSQTDLEIQESQRQAARPAERLGISQKIKNALCALRRCDVIEAAHLKPLASLERKAIGSPQAAAVAMVAASLNALQKARPFSPTCHGGKANVSPAASGRTPRPMSLEE
jgi:hypothetical protein